MKAIAAMDLNRVIGYKGNIPWHLPEDFKWFKSKTMGQSLLMGNTTYKSVGVLPGRFTYVLTTDEWLLSHPDSSNIAYVNEATLFKKTKWVPSDTIWVCGGAKTYQKYLPYCDELFVTLVLNEYEGDTYMPEFESMFPNSEIVRETKDFWIVRYWK
jgi:dihydrofolate reductase